MIFKQLFDKTSSTYTYLISSGINREALIIDPVLENVDEYIKILEDLNLKLVKVIDTHIHADHITGMGELEEKTNCQTVMGDKTPIDVISMRVRDGEEINIDGISVNNEKNTMYFLFATEPFTLIFAFNEFDISLISLNSVSFKVKFELSILIYSIILK